VAARVEVDERARVRPLAEHGVPGAQARALEARPRRDDVLVEAFRVVVGDDRLAPVALGDGAPGTGVADGVPRLDLEGKRLERLAPPRARVQQSRLVADRRALRAARHDRLQL